MRVLRLMFLALPLGTLACDEPLRPEADRVHLSFTTERILTWPDSGAYVYQVLPGQIDLVGFFTACSYTMEGRLVQAEEASIVVDAEISLCPGFLCIVDKHLRYRARLTGVRSGEHRVILEHVIRRCISGELLDGATVLDTVVTVPS